jgi:hypothetical protein
VLQLNALLLQIPGRYTVKLRCRLNNFAKIYVVLFFRFAFKTLDALKAPASISDTYVVFRKRAVSPSSGNSSKQRSLWPRDCLVDGLNTWPNVISL